MFWIAHLSFAFGCVLSVVGWFWVIDRSACYAAGLRSVWWGILHVLFGTVTGTLVFMNLFVTSAVLWRAVS